mgnify:CR=1 FL=1
MILDAVKSSLQHGNVPLFKQTVMKMQTAGMTVTLILQAFVESPIVWVSQSVISEHHWIAHFVLGNTFQLCAANKVLLIAR